MGEGRESDHKGRKEDQSPALHPMPRTPASGMGGQQPWLSCLLPLPPYHPEKPGAAVLRRSQAETRTWDGGFGESQRTGQPATPSSARPAWAGSAAPLDASIGQYRIRSRPCHRQLASTQSLMLSCGTQAWPEAYEEGGAGQLRPSDPDCVSTGRGATRACLGFRGFRLRLSSQLAHAGSPAPPKWVSEHD